MRMKKKSNRFSAVAALLLAAFVLIGSGCSPTMMRSATIGAIGGPAVLDILDVLLDSPNARVLQEAMPGNIALITAVTEMAPTRDLYQVCCFVYTSYGIMVEDKDVPYAKDLYVIGKEYGMKALCMDHDFKAGIDEGKKIPELTAGLDKRYTASLAWAGLATGLLIIHQMDDPLALMGLPDAVALVNRSVELDDKYFFGVGKAFLGAYYALMPEFLGLGGGPVASAEMFNKARAITGGKFLLVDVFEARYLKTYIDDREGFDALLNKVLAADSKELKGGRALNEMAKVKANYFMSIADTLF